MLLRFDPFRELDRLATTLSGPALVSRAGVGGIPVDMYRRDGNLIVHADVPGVTDDNLTVTVDGADLVIRTERRYAPDPGDDIFVTGRSWGDRTCRIRIPERYDTAKVTATLDRGVLTVTVPAAAGHVGPRHIPIAAAGEPSAELTGETNTADVPVEAAAESARASSTGDSS